MLRLRLATYIQPMRNSPKCSIGWGRHSRHGPPEPRSRPISASLSGWSSGRTRRHRQAQPGTRRHTFPKDLTDATLKNLGKTVIPYSRQRFAKPRPVVSPTTGPFLLVGAISREKPGSESASVSRCTVQCANPAALPKYSVPRLGWSQSQRGNYSLGRENVGGGAEGVAGMTPTIGRGGGLAV